MARPIKRGLDYFSLDCDYWDDDKIEVITTLFDLDGEAVIIRLWCQIYKEHGYYMQWSKDKAITFTRKLGSRSCTLDKINAIVDEALKRDIFDKKLYNEYNILTSKRIQKQYISAAKERTQIEVIKEFWLLEEEELNVSVAFKFVSPPNNLVFLPDNSINPPDSTQRKEKKSKIKNNIYTWDVENAELKDALLAFIEYRKTIKRPLTDYGVKLIIGKLNKYTSDVQTQIEIINQSIERGWQGVFPLITGRTPETLNTNNITVEEIQRLEAEWNGQATN